MLGRNSKKIAESTGRLPPTPILHKAAKVPIAAKFGDPADINPKTEVIPIVKLNAHLLPKISQPNPQKIAPASNPMFCDRESRGGFEGENSLAMGYSEGYELQIRDLGTVYTYGENQGRNDRPQIVGCVPETDNYEQLPLIPSHANVLDLSTIL